MKNKIALRMDDVGASSKQYEIYSKKLFGMGNFLFLKRLKWLKAWGVYREMTEQEWIKVFDLLDKYKAKLTVGITACWVEYDGTLTSFPKKYPEEARLLKYGHDKGFIEIANHGLTHCVLKNNLFLPRLFCSNRTYHREFWDWLDQDTHTRHVRKSQEILQSYFGGKITTLIPPGNVYSEKTIFAAKEQGIRLINCNTDDLQYDSLRVVGNTNVLAFHDREIVEFGVAWLNSLLEKYKNHQFVFVRDL